MSIWGWGPTLILAGIWEEVTLQKGSVLKKWVCWKGLIGPFPPNPHPGSAMGALGNMRALCPPTSKHLCILHN